MNTINVENCKTLLIGWRGENEVTTVAFDFTEWATEFGSGVVDLYVKRFGDDSAYPVVLTIDGTVASWLVTETDTNVAGYGKAEYVYRVDGKIAKSAVFPFFVAEDIGQPASEPPDPYESWLEQLTALGAETEAHAQAAEQSAEDAAESAQEAAGSATSAEGYAGQAETAAGLAQAAQTTSEAARDAAQTAQASAEASATAASGSAASAASSATAASASATTASNAATAAQTAQSAAEDAAEDAQQAAQQAHVEYEQLSGEVDDLSDEVAQQKSAIEDLTALVDRKAGMLVDTASGAIASFVPDATIDNLLCVSVEIEPVQAGSGDPSPDNVRPISGWDSVEVDADGVNLWDEQWEQGGWDINTGEKISGVRIINKNMIPVHPGQTLYLKLWAGATNDIRLFYFDRNKEFLVASGWLVQGVTTIPADCYWINFFTAGAYGTTYNHDISINYPATDYAYHPYSGNRYTIQLGQTIYGGTLSIAEDGSVNALVDRVSVDMGTLNWFAGYNGYVVSPPLTPSPATNTVPANILCDVYKTMSYSGGTDKSICRVAGTNYVRVRDSAYSTAAAFKTAMNGHRLVYELASPITIQLDPVTISTIADQTNNVWSDAGDARVEFAADLKHYIDSKIAAAVAALS